MKTAKEVWAVLRFCGYIEGLSKVYKDWIRNDKGIIGFYGYVGGEGDKLKKLERIKEWCEERFLPVIIIDDSKMKTRFKIKLINGDKGDHNATG